MCFCRSRVQWLRDTALEELFARAAEVTEEKRLTQLYVVLDVLEHHFLGQFSNLLCTERVKNGACPYMGALLCTLCPGGTDRALGTCVEGCI